MIQLFLNNAAFVGVRTTPDAIMRSWCRPDWRSQAAGSNCTSSQPTAHMSIRSSGCGGLMHKHTFKDFSEAILNFLREEVPRNRRIYCNETIDRFVPIISPGIFGF